MSVYRPTTEEAKKRTHAYDRLQHMRELKAKKMPHFANQFGWRSFNEYIDDSERILNGYVLTREAQGKDDWQSNMMDNITRAKLRAVVSGVALRPPPLKAQAVNTNGQPSAIRAALMENTIKQSYLDSNPKLQAFLETWTLLSHGVVFEYEGYQTGGAKIRQVDSFNSLTGEVKEKEVYVKGDGKPFCALLSSEEFFWEDMFILDIQDQPGLGWVQHYTKRMIETEFSKYPNYKYIKDKSQVAHLSADQQDLLLYSKWRDSVDLENDYAVFRRYSKEEDAYEIWVNGVPMLLAPLLWGGKKKYYPFGKTICDPFANPNFFVGMSLPGILEAYQDGKNTVLNSLVDKLYRSFDPPLLIGLQNKDLFDWESEFIVQDNRYYVPDVEAVKTQPVNGVNQGELAMLQILDRGIESVSIASASAGIPKGGVTATADKIAAIKAEELKTSIYVFLEDLWLQKYRLRVRTILTHYLKDKAASESTQGNIINVKDFQFNDGARGTLAIHVAKNPKDLLPLAEIEARELAAEQEGHPFKLISIPANYLDDHEYDFTIVPQAFQRENNAEKEEALKGELELITTLFPEFFVANKDKYLGDALAIYGKHPDEYNAPGAAPALPTDTPLPENPADQPAPQPAGAASVLGL